MRKKQANRISNDLSEEILKTRERKIKKLKKWLLAGKKITNKQISRMYAYDRGSDGIFKLRRPPHNMNIKTIPTVGVDRDLNPVRYATYVWLGEKPKIIFSHTTSGVKIYHFFHQYPMKANTVKKHITSYLTKRKVSIKNLRSLRLRKTRSFGADTSAGGMIFKINPQ